MRDKRKDNPTADDLSQELREVYKQLEYILTDLQMIRNTFDQYEATKLIQQASNRIEEAVSYLED